MKNQLKTVMLLGLLTALLLWVGQLVGGMQGLTVAIIFAVIMNFGSYWFSSKIALAMYRAKKTTREAQPRLFNIVKEVALKANIPMPTVFIIPSSSPNAFATGRNPKNAAVACTQGILELLNDTELEGVIAHEISHIKNRDILIATIAATIAGVISYVAMMSRWAAIFGGFGGRDRDSSSGLEFIVLAILTPLIATIIQLSISRSREFLADEGAGKITQQPWHLADALEKLDSSISHNPMRFGNKAAASLFIANPFRGRSLFQFFSTHPKTADRVKRLRDMRV